MNTLKTMVNRCRILFALARETMQRQAETQALRYNMMVRPMDFAVGNPVWYLSTTPSRAKGQMEQMA